MVELDPMSMNLLIPRPPPPPRHQRQEDITFRCEDRLFRLSRHSFFFFVIYSFFSRLGFMEMVVYNYTQ